MTPNILMDETALKLRFQKVRSAMLQRARPKLWKSGKRAGKVKKPGIDRLPFTSQQLWQRALDQVGTGAARCPYCEAIGRPANLITLANLEWDHVVPVAHGGSHELCNLRAVCQDCNRLKANLSLMEFLEVMKLAETFTPQGRSLLHACLRTHGVSQRLRGFHGKPAAKPEPATDLHTASLPLTENW